MPKLIIMFTRIYALVAITLALTEVKKIDTKD